MILLAFVAVIALHQCAAFVHPSALLGMPQWHSEHRAASSADVRLSDFGHDNVTSVMSCAQDDFVVVGRYVYSMIDDRLIVVASHRAHALDAITTHA